MKLTSKCRSAATSEGAWPARRKARKSMASTVCRVARSSLPPAGRKPRGPADDRRSNLNRTVRIDGRAPAARTARHRRAGPRVRRRRPARHADRRRRGGRRARQADALRARGRQGGTVRARRRGRGRAAARPPQRRARSTSRGRSTTTCAKRRTGPACSSPPRATARLAARVERSLRRIPAALTAALGDDVLAAALLGASMAALDGGPSVERLARLLPVPDQAGPPSGVWTA